MTVVATPEVDAFRRALDAAKPDDWLRIPGLGGPFRARHIRKGLDKGAIMLHWSGKGFGWATVTARGDKGDVLRLHPEVWQLESDLAGDDRVGPRMGSEATKRLLTTFHRIRLGLEKAPAPAVDLSFDL